MPERSLWMRLFPALWMRWAISIVVAVAAVVALIVFVEHNNANNEVAASPKSLARENRQAQVVVGADQAPQTVARKPGQPLHQAFAAAVRNDINHRIETGNISGRLQKINCGGSGARPGRVAYQCVAEVSDVNYQFVGVFDRSSKRITYCKRDPPPIPSEKIPVSPRCRL